LVLLFGFFFIFGFGVSAKAQTITWAAAAPITGDSNLITSGTELDALLTNPASTSPITVDGLKFNLAKTTSNTPPTATDKLDLGWQITSGDSNPYSWPNYSQPGASSAFDTLMESGGVYSNGGSATGIVTISNLTPGDSYAVQVFQWAADNDPGLVTLSGTNSVTLSDGGFNSSSGEFATGTFVATGSQETFDWAGDGSLYTPLGPISVQDLGLNNVPEPSSDTLTLSGMLLFFIWHWFRRSKASPKAPAGALEFSSSSRRPR
jgi:hypothetical protein